MNTKLTGVGSRLIWRLLFLVWVALLIGATGAKAEPVKTLVQDTLYRADGSVAQGTIAIRWNGFSTSAGEAVMAGELTITTNANGGIAIPLIPNAGSNPAGGYYKVVVKLDDGTTSEEVWVVPAATTTTVAAIRAKVVPQAVAAQFASVAYVNSLLNNLAANPPVHLSGAESISGTKTFLASPEVPVPSDVGGAANKGYVDQKISAQPSVNLASPGPIGSVTPGTVNATGITASGGVTAGASVSATHPTIDITHPAYGAKCDGATDDTAALQAAITAAGANGGSILIPGLGSGCYIANPTSLTWPTMNGTLALNVQGKMILGSTLMLPDWIDVIGQGGAAGVQFHGVGPTASIQGSNTTGTLGTAALAGVSTTFTPSTMTGIHPGTVMTVVGKAACTITSISRTSNEVTAVMSGACHVAPGYYASVAGVTDSSYNGSTFLVNVSDYVANTLSWQQTGANSTSSGGTLSGVNEDSIETAIVTATTSDGKAVASFTQAHSSADAWGIAGLYLTGMAHHTLNNLTVSASGVAIWAYHASGVHLNGVSAQNLSDTSQALEINESFWIYIHDSAFMTDYGHGSWGVRFTNINPGSSNGAGMAWIDNSNIMGGIKLDRGSGFGQGNIYLTNVVIEQPTRGAFAVDSTFDTLQLLDLDKVFLQDNFYGFQPCYVSSLYPSTQGAAVLRGINTAGSGCMANQNYHGAITVAGEYGPIDMGSNYWGGTSNYLNGFTASNGRVTETELRGSGANFSPSLIPYATLPVPAMSTWTGTAGCSITTGVLSPAGTSDAITLTGSGGSAQWLNPYSYSVTPAVGDVVLFGVWVKGPANDIAQGWNGVTIGLGGMTTYQYVGMGLGSTSNFEMPIIGDWWHPVVGALEVASSTGAAATVQMWMGCQSAGISYYQPWLIYVPASAGIPANEIRRWRQQLLHGYVPSGMPASVLAMNPAFKLYWGNDTNLYRDAAGVVKTDGSFNVGSGQTYQIGGAQITSGALGDWTNAGVANGYVPTWNSTTSKWTPGAAGGGGLTTAGGQTITAADTLTGLPSGCLQYPCVVANQASSTYSGTGGFSNGLYTTSSSGAGLYRLCGYIDITVAGTAGNFYISGQYTTDGHYLSFSYSPAAAAATLWSNANICYVFYSDASKGINFQLYGSGVTGSPTVRYAGTLERLQ